MLVCYILLRLILQPLKVENIASVNAIVNIKNAESCMFYHLVTRLYVCVIT